MRKKINLIALGKTMLILMISVGVTIDLTQKNISALCGFILMLLGLYGYYKFEKEQQQ